MATEVITDNNTITANVIYHSLHSVPGSHVIVTIRKQGFYFSLTPVKLQYKF